MKYYIAYGSNLNKTQMKKRCPSAYPVGYAEIEGYRLLFCDNLNEKYPLTIKKMNGRYVPVIIWLISEEDEKVLDDREGISSGNYLKKNWKVTIKKALKSDVREGEEIEAIIYIMPEEEDRKCGKPKTEYYNKCQVGYEEFGFDLAILKTAYNESYYEDK